MNSEASVDVTRPTLEDGSRIPYLGRMVPLKIFCRQEQNKIRFSRGEFNVSLKSRRPNKEAIRSMYHNWLYERAEKPLSSMVAKYSTIVGVSPDSIIVKKMKKRWGSATKNNILNLNLN